jgi:glutathione synthase/RimK-type ligase-like ATP-grasp enzyme
MDIKDCDILMWHHNHSDPKDIVFAKQLLFALEHSGIKVFPDFKTAWHFDDKVGQKYLMEALHLPMVPSHVFYSKKEALNWIAQTDFPKVFKLRGGAGSANVQLVKDRKEAKALVGRAFGKGFSQYEPWSNIKERIRKFKEGKGSLKDIGKGIIRFIYPPLYARVRGKERGYVYFQDFIPGNDHDIRVIVIDKKAFAIKRMTRENDFRASGSGKILFEKELFDEKIIRLSFEVAERLDSQCLALDFVFHESKALIVEISFGFTKEPYYACPGYWDENLTWHEGAFDAQGWMVEAFLKEHASKKPK